MGKSSGVRSSLFLLPEEPSQSEVRTETRYLFNSEFNRYLSWFFDTKQVDYVYISINHGILTPKEEVEPYNIKKLGQKQLFVWSFCTSQLVSRYCEEREIDSIVSLCSGKKYVGLEEMLKESFTVNTPVRKFSSQDLIMKWLSDFLEGGVFSE